MYFKQYKHPPKGTSTEVFCDTQMKHYVFIRPDPKFNGSQLKDSYDLLSLVSSDRIPIELVLSSYFLLKSNQFPSEVSGNLADHGQ